MRRLERAVTDIHTRDKRSLAQGKHGTADSAHNLASPEPSRLAQVKIVLVGEQSQSWCRTGIQRDHSRYSPRPTRSTAVCRIWRRSEGRRRRVVRVSGLLNESLVRCGR